MSLHYLVKLEMLIGHLLPLSCYYTEINSTYSTSSVDSNFVRFESSWLQLPVSECYRRYYKNTVATFFPRHSVFSDMLSVRIYVVR